VADQEHDKEGCGVDGNAKDAAGADEIPGVAVHRIGRKHLSVPGVEKIYGGAQDDEGDKRGQKRPRLQVADQEAVDAAERGANRQRRNDREPNRQFQHEQEIERGEIAECKDGADAEINPAADQAESHGKRHKAELGKQPQQ
jgi:hypothetical protein